ncbi:MAG: methyltransferase domain-containing protein [Patescibacteria group bacterium]|nr:methyltransferase domain-containing protein [Patescibacteria group bacterium]
MCYSKIIYKIKIIYLRIKIIKEKDFLSAHFTFLKVFGWKHIHYGYYKNKNDSIIDAQENLSKLVIDKIPVDTKDIIDVGGGIGSMARQFMNKNYHCLCVVPDQNFIKYGKKHNPKVSFLLTSAENLKIDKKFDLAVLIESYQYFINTELAISNIVSCLKEHSSLIILDEFDKEGVPLKNTEVKLIKILSQNKYVLIEKQDLTKNIIPTTDFAINLAKDLNSKKYLKNWSFSKKIYADDNRKYLLLVFHK